MPFAAVLTDASDDQTMGTNMKVMCFGDVISNLQQLFALKLDQFFALAAIEMIVLRIAIVVFINASAVKHKFSQ